MKTIEQLIPNYPSVTGNRTASVSSITIDSRTTTADCMYVALVGTQVNGHQFIEQAISQGATSILHSEPLNTYHKDVTYIQSDNVSALLGEILVAFYDNCIHDLVIIGTTGTNGKTTISTLLFDLFTHLGYQCGLISTVSYNIGNQVFTSTHTTPDPISLHALFHKMHQEGCTHVFMEVSSHAIHQNRIAGIPFKGCIFSNITHDHLDYHGTFSEYIKAKKALFDGLGTESFALTNKDDKNGLVMLQNTKATRYTYGLRGTSDFNAKILESDFSGMHLRFADKDIWTPLVGNFNAYNLLAVYAAAQLITEGQEDIEVAMSALRRVNGRFESIAGPEGRTVIVDYAHTPDALQNVIDTIKLIQKADSQLITVVGCGGNRDKEKRGPMGAIASNGSNRCLFTSDNPRNEQPEDIINDMMQGVRPADLRKVLKITDREEAIKTAIALSFPGDTILIAGKGHETYQEIKGERRHFDDRIAAQNALNQIR